MRAIDLYSGIGGWSLGLTLSGIDVVELGILVSDKEFHTPHSLHWPTHFGCLAPQEPQT